MIELHAHRFCEWLGFIHEGSEVNGWALQFNSVPSFLKKKHISMRDKKRVAAISRDVIGTYCETDSCNT